MNETGATVLLREHGSGNSEVAIGEGCTRDIIPIVPQVVNMCCLAHFF